MKKGFTLLELTVVLVIIGILAAIGLPSYSKVIERSRAAEGASILGALRAAQLRYYDEHDNYLPEGNVADLDVTVTTPKFFTYNTYDADDRIAYVDRNNEHLPDFFGNYRLYIYPDGRIVCSNASDVICAALSLPYEE